MRAAWIALGAAAYVAFAIASFPASAAYHWFAPADLRLSGLQGTVWSGRADLGSTGTLGFHNIRWQLRPWSILLARPSVRFETSLGDGFLHADVRVGAGEVVLRGLRAGCSLSTLAAVLPIDGIRGQISVDLTELVLQDGRPAGATGTLRLAQLTVPSLVPGGVGDSIALGSYHVSLAGTGALRGAFEDQGGPLQVRGSVSLSADGRYEISGLAQAAPDAPLALVRGLEMLTGAPDETGMRAFSFTGTI